MIRERAAGHLFFKAAATLLLLLLGGSSAGKPGLFTYIYK
jgi:hypothetical protein